MRKSKERASSASKSWSPRESNAQFLLTREALPKMREGGTIINVSSIQAAFVFLASNESRYVNGEVLGVAHRSARRTIVCDHKDRRSCRA
jgi:NAD(P)-dependent dehydrogenase (short-subunit alcohol dehydrogenase family)